jgi:hypothetical protein
VYCLSLITNDKISLCHFFWAQNTTYFVLKNYALIEYNIVYVLVIFSEYFEMLEFKISKLQNSVPMEPKLQNDHSGGHAC